MKPISLFEKTSPYGGIYVFFMVNRIQMLYFDFIMPKYLVDPYMIWGILAGGILSQINLVLISKFFVSGIPTQGYKGFVELLGERLVRFLCMFGLLFILIKIIVIALGFIEIIHQFIFPSMNANWLVLLFFLISCNLAIQGMEKTIRFVVIVFLLTFWKILFFFSFFFAPIASLHDLFPLLPIDWSGHSFKGLLFVLSSFSGPEYLILLSPWFDPKHKMLKHMTWANWLSVFEYLILFVSSLVFFGSLYLNKINFPVINMLRYLRSPVLERIDILLLSLHMFRFVFSTAIFLLCFYGAVRIIAGKVHEQTTRRGFLTSCIMIFVCMILVKKWLWGPGTELNLFPDLQIWLGATTYILVPIVLLIASKRKGRVKA